MLETPEFLQLIKHPPPANVLALDPGGTTGWAWWRKGMVAPVAGQSTVRIDSLDDFLSAFENRSTGLTLDWVVAEDYRVYASHLEQHAMSALPTVRLLGAIEHRCVQLGAALQLTLAAPVKAFVTDEKLQAWGLHQHGQVHANDAIRHLCYFLIFRPDIAPSTVKYKAGKGRQVG